MKKVFINPGWGRTAGTTLRDMYWLHSQICTLARPWSNETRAFIVELTRNEANYNHRLVLNMIDRFYCGDDKAYLLSDENILDGNALQPNTGTISVFARRIKELFKDPCIILNLRNQITWIESYYSNLGRKLKNVPKPFDGRYVGFLPWLEWQSDNWEHSFIDLIDYNKYVNIFVEIFGRENVHVFLYEDFVHQQEVFVSELCSLMGIDETEGFSLVQKKHINPQKSANVIRYMRFREWFFPSVRLHTLLPGGNTILDKFSVLLRKGPPQGKIRIPDEWEKRLRNYYREGNVALSNEFGVREKFIEYGYSMDGNSIS
tara:strand:+ start:10021 stop:10971 length:951 start_codon:yes stop_codon:yes gene_type:complete